ncbi:hypothetical protein GCM10028816_18550 [Spirosoma lituiforme]
MYNGRIHKFLPAMRPHRSRITCLVGILLVLSLGSLSACGQEKKAKTATVPVDTTIVDDDTLEVDDVSGIKQTEHAR